ncbi:MAG: mechanosensitive ion channel family protein [Acidobacteria bacterium]|nr:mechanosensitive ion channel family protein [Acidobacteriota bacterium]
MSWEHIVENFRQFWLVVVDVWQDGVWGVDIGRILVALFIFFLFLVFRHLISRMIIRRLAAVAKKTRFRFDDEVVDVLEKPFTFIPVILGFFFATEYLAFSGSLADIAHRLLRSLIVWFLFWSLVRLVHPLSFLFRQVEEIFSPTMVEWLLKSIRIAFIFIGAGTILEIWGIQVLPLLAGLGLFGVAVALGAQDLFKNLISGILIIAERRFSPGDWIAVDGVVEGTVEAIGFRSTLVRRFDKAPVFVPNANLSDNVVTNFSAMTHRRIYWTVGVLYSTRVEQLRRIRDGIERHILESGDFAKPPEVPAFVRIDRFNDSSIDIMLYCFTRTTVWGEWLEIKERLAYRVKEIVEEAGSGFAFPSRSLYLESVPPGAPEPFQAPGPARIDAPEGI